MGATGTLVGAATVAFVYLLVFGYYVFTPDGSERSGLAEDLATGWAPTTFFALGACLAALLVAYRARSQGVLLGLMAGVVAATTHQLMILVGYPPVVPLEALTYGGLGALGGTVGVWLGEQEAKRSATGERVLFRAMEDMACAF